MDLLRPLPKTSEPPEESGVGDDADRLSDTGGLVANRTINTVINGVCDFIEIAMVKTALNPITHAQENVPDNLESLFESAKI